MTDQTPSPSALYQRANRLKKKLKAQEVKDIIEKQIEAQAKKIMTVKRQHKNNDWDFEGREPQDKLVPQYPEQKNGYAFNVWGSASDTQPTINPLDKISHSDNLRKLFFDRAE